MKKMFWVVNHRYFDSGKVIVKVFMTLAENPQNTVSECMNCDIYNDYFATEAEARAFAKQAKST